MTRMNLSAPGSNKAEQEKGAVLGVEAVGALKDQSLDAYKRAKDARELLSSKGVTD